MIAFAVFLATIACVLGAAIPKSTYPQLDGRIVGGDPTTIEVFPWQVSIQIDGNHFCGGSIIGPYHILTAGHCFPSYVAISRYLVRAGSTRSTTGGSLHKIDSVKIHENYDAYKIENDITIVKLATPVEFSDKVKPISLPTADPVDGVEAAVSGWGHTTAGRDSLPDQLRYALVNIIENKKCGSEYGYGINRITDSMFCAMAAGKDACQGDSGGPLEYKGRLVGIVSWGIGCADSRYPGVYTNVARFRDWVKRNVGN